MVVKKLKTSNIDFLSFVFVILMLRKVEIILMQIALFVTLYIGCVVHRGIFNKHGVIRDWRCP